MRPSPPADAPVVITPAVLRGWSLPLPADGDKRARGTVLVIGGCPETPGAPMLAGLAALRAGAGRLQLAISARVALGLAIAVPEALVLGLDDTGADIDVEPALAALDEPLATADAVLIGPGLAPEASIAPLIEGALQRVGPETIVVLDAAALACLRDVDDRWLARAAGRLVVTPNRQEAATIAPEIAAVADAARQAVAAAQRVSGVASVHGEVACADGRAWSIGTGAIGLGTSGSGDVLAGLVTGVAARCGDAAQAACWGSYLHGAAGDRLSARVGPVGFLARELLDEVPPLMAELSL